MRTNVRVSAPAPRTHNGGIAQRINKEQELRRTVLTCMLYEDNFYEDGVSVASRIADLVKQVDPEKVAQIAIEAREKQKLRHVPLLIVREMARLPEYRKYVADTLERVIQRPDELGEYVAIYMKEKRQPLSKQSKRGLARALAKFEEYALSKYSKSGAYTIRDILFMIHGKPTKGIGEDAEKLSPLKKKKYARGAVHRHKDSLYEKIVNKTLKTADTWESRLSAGKGKNKKEEWENLIKENKLGALAFLRNLRNMQESGVQKTLIREGLTGIKTDRVLPFRFISAAKYAPDMENELETLMFKCLKDHEKLQGETILLVDKSGSMSSNVSGKSELSRYDAGVALAMLIREVCDDPVIYTFNDSAKKVVPRRGFSLRDAMGGTSGGTNVGASIRQALNDNPNAKRLIVITDEQSTDSVGVKTGILSYGINVGNDKNGVLYRGNFLHLDGWSESIVDYIVEYEKTLQ